MYYPQRKSIRLRGYDYSQGGVYFCTVCVHRIHRHKELFARIEEGQARLNRFGRVVERCWQETPLHRSTVELDGFVVMPNHFHGLLLIDAPSQTAEFHACFGPQLRQSLSSVIGAFKSDVTKEIGRLRREKTVVWQPRFHDHIVRNDQELLAIRRYIENNPANWVNDRCHPQHPDFERVWQNLSPDPQNFIS
ncbi:MAG: transposase [Armatimonadetes bacterium]|nr:transposase [Armatimonadota bacterium]